MSSSEASTIEAELDPPFSIQRPERLGVPFIFNSPHSGRVYPRAFLAASRLDALSLRKSEDAYVEELFGAAPDHGAPLMHAHFPRAYLDLNREPYELDPALITDALPRYANTQSIRVVGGLGTIARVVTESEEIYREPLPLGDALRRINQLYKPYHDALGDLMLECRQCFGTAILIDCHSMPSNPASESGGPRPDFVLGDRFSTSCDSDLTRTVAKMLRGMGYVVALNKPYAGGFITEHYGRPSEGLHTLQIEVNRALYMNETNFAKEPGFDRVRKHMSGLIEMLAEYSASLHKIPKAAAE
jgi:N-formylglutamate amidohydrolase